jgi:hypothetical protein
LFLREVPEEILATVVAVELVDTEQTLLLLLALHRLKYLVVVGLLSLL